MTNGAERSWQEDAKRASRRVAAGVWAGVLSGAVIGGVGGRIAMFVLRLTSDPALHGVKTDDGFEIGAVTGDSLFLILFTASLGGLGGLFYLAVRPWLPARSRPAVMGVFGALVGGALVVRPDGVDFQILEPRWLAIALFVTLPGLYGLALAASTERLLRWDDEGQGRQMGWIGALAPLVAVLVAGPFGLVALVVLALGWLLTRPLPVAEAWTSAPAAWLGRGLLLAAAVAAAVSLVRDVPQIL